MGKPSPCLLALAVAGMISLSGCAGEPFRTGQAPAGQVARRTLGPKLPNAADPDYNETYGRYREQFASQDVVVPALGYERQGDSGTIHQVGLRGRVASVAESISSTIGKGFSKAGEAMTPEQQVDKALDATSVFNKSKPSADLYVAMARLQEQSGKPAEAEQQYRLALEMAPDHLGALLGYAHLMDRAGHLEGAVALYQRAAGAYPTEPSVLNDLGLCFARNGKFNEAVSALNRAIQLEPKKPLYHNNMAIVLVEMGQNDPAFLHLRVVHPEAVARYNLGQLLLRKDQREAAAEQFALALKSDPSLAQAKAWLDELARSGLTPQQPAARIAARPATTIRNQVIDRPALQNPPMPEERSTRNLQSVYGNYPVPPGRRLQRPAGRLLRPSRPTPTATRPEPGGPWLGAPRTQAPMENAPLPQFPTGSAARLPVESHSVAPLPPVTGSAGEIEPLPPIEPAPVPAAY